MDNNINSNPIPVTLLSGFLGAGKTTLLNVLLTEQHTLRFAIVENEFGAVNIDSQLITRQSGGLIELSNGCICCTVNDDLVRGLEELRHRRATGELNFNWIIVETTGLADPGVVAQTFFAAPELRDTFKLDGIITLVDALHAAQELKEHPVVARQIGFADALLISKSELIDNDSMRSLQERLTAINLRAPHYTLLNGRLSNGALPPILGIGGFDLTNTLLADPKLRFSPRPSRNTAWRATPRSLHSLHDDGICSHLLEGGKLELAKIDHFIETLIADFGTNLLRYKGILAIADEPRRLIFQGVQRVAGFDYGAAWQDDEPRLSRIVLIGKNLPIKELQKRFAATAPQ